MLASGSDSVPFTQIGGLNNTFPQGRKVTQWQINDNLTWSRGSTHCISASIRAVSTQATMTLAKAPFQPLPTTTWRSSLMGPHIPHSQNFPVSLKERVGVGNLEYYAMDTYKPSLKATITYGMRVTWNTNVTSPQALFSRMAGSFLDASHEYQSAVESGRSRQRFKISLQQHHYSSISHEVRLPTSFARTPLSMQDSVYLMTSFRSRSPIAV